MSIPACHRDPAVSPGACAVAFLFALTAMLIVPAEPS